MEIFWIRVVQDVRSLFERGLHFFFAHSAMDEAAAALLVILKKAWITPLMNKFNKKSRVKDYIQRSFQKV